MSLSPTLHSEVALLRQVLMRRVADAYVSQDRVDGQWEELRYTRRPDFGAALEEGRALEEAVRAAGAEILYLDDLDDSAGPSGSGLTLDSIYVRDASVVCDDGVVLCRMGKEARRGEPEVQGRAFEALGIPVIGAISGEGLLEGGDVVWLDPRTLAVGLGYRTNQEGIEQLRNLLGDRIDELIVVPLPHWRGPSDVFHLMSILSPLDERLALVHSPLMPVPFRETLLERGFELVEVEPDEFATQGCNALALAPGRCLLAEGNPRTRDRLQHAGVDVAEYRGWEISAAGEGGPTCLTRPIVRAPSAAS